MLEKMLQKDKLYYHPKIGEKFEVKARVNITNEISMLQKELQAIRSVAKSVLK